MQPSQEPSDRMLTALVLHVVSAVLSKKSDPLVQPFVTILTNPQALKVSIYRLSVSVCKLVCSQTSQFEESGDKRKRVTYALTRSLSHASHQSWSLHSNCRRYGHRQTTMLRPLMTRVLWLDCAVVHSDMFMVPPSTLSSLAHAHAICPLSHLSVIQCYCTIIETNTPGLGILRNVLIDVMSCSKDNNCSQKLPIVVSAAAEGK